MDTRRRARTPRAACAPPARRPRGRRSAPARRPALTVKTSRSAASIACSRRPSTSPTSQPANAPRASGSARPTSASQASTACRTASATTPRRSRPVASASPTRRIVSASSWRLRSTSSIFASSCSDMSLNSRPSAANSSFPWTGTGWRKSPRERRRAAARKVAIWPASARPTKPAETRASSTNRPGDSAISRRFAAICSETDALGLNTPSRTVGPGDAVDRHEPAAVLLAVDVKVVTRTSSGRPFALGGRRASRRAACRPAPSRTRGR